MKTTDPATLLRCLPELYEAYTLESLPRHLSRFLTRIISADAVAYNEVNLKQSRAVVTIDPPEINTPDFLRAFEAHMAQHPLIRHQQQSGDMSARKISDFLSRAQFHRLGLYQEVYRRIGAEDQFALSLHVTPHTIVALAMNRSHRSFTEADRNVLNILQPHFIQAYRNAEALTLLQQQRAAAYSVMENLSLALVVLNPRLRIQFAAQRARRLLHRYFNLPAASRVLPAPLRAWLLRSRRWRGRALPGATGSFSLEGPSGKLTVQCVSEPGHSDTILLLEETGRPLSSKPLESLGLTARQAEVLLWVAQGKSNPEIAIILGIASRTVQKHLEHIFASLGVESRTAAARRALEILNGHFH